MNQAPRNPVTATHTRRRRRSLTRLASGPTVAKPPAAAALDVPTAGVPTYLVASPPPAADVFAASGFGLAESVSGPAMRYLLVLENYQRPMKAPHLPPYVIDPTANSFGRKWIDPKLQFVAERFL